LEPTTAPTDTPPPAKTPKPATANLVITKFELDDNYILVETPTDYLVTVKNTGSADAGPFSVSVLEANEDDGSHSQSDPKMVNGLAAGKSTKVTISISLPKAGHWRLTATADSNAAVDESNEEDNDSEVSARVLAGLPDLAWSGSGFTMTPDAQKPGYFDIAAQFANQGTDDLAQESAFIGITWYRDEDGASGDLTPMPLTDMAKGEVRLLEGSQQMPGPGTYTVYALLDRDHVLNELSSDNNETSIRLTVP
jgi:hypothetical protein